MNGAVNVLVFLRARLYRQHMSYTNEQSLRTLCNVLLTRLEKGNYIVFNPKDRALVREELYQVMKGVMLTEEDVIEMARDAVSGRAQDIADKNITETDAFKMKKRDIKADFSYNEVAGFYLTSSLREVSGKVSPFLLDCKAIEDVFETDEAIQRMVQESILNFDESKIS